MKLDRATTVLRPRGFLGSSDLAFRFVWALNRRSWLGLFLLVLFPAWLAGVLLHSYRQLPWGWIWLLAITYGSVAQGVFSSAAGLLLFESRAPIRSVLREYLRRAFVHAVVVLFSRAMALAMLPLSGFGAYLWVRWAFVHEAVLLEQAGVTQATKRSGVFTRHQADDVILLLFLLCNVSLLFIACFEALGHGVEQLLMLPWQADDAAEEGGSAYALLGYFASLPFCAVMRFLCYVDGRTRRDGWDIQVRFMSLAAEAEAETERVRVAGGVA